MAGDPERDRGVLSKKDRLYLLDAGEEETKSSKGRVTRSRIRDRIYNGVLDFKIIRNEVEARDRQKVFEDFPDDMDFRQGVIAAVEFLYQGIEETDHDFEEVLVPAIESAERKLSGEDKGHNIEVDIEFDVETKLLLTDRDPEDYTDEELGKMLLDGQIDGESAYHLLEQRFSDNTRDIT